MLVRFVRIVVIVLGFSLAAPFQPVFAQAPIHGKKDTKKRNPVAKVEQPPKQPSRAAPPLKTTSDAKENKRSPSAPAAIAVPRGVSPRTERSIAARQAFERQTGYANGRPGYMVEHIVPLSCGGTDTPDNMQWLTLAEARRKNRFERARCR